MISNDTICTMYIHECIKTILKTILVYFFLLYFFVYIVSRVHIIEFVCNYIYCM